MKRIERIREPFWTGVFLAIAFVVAGFLSLGFAWRGVARTLFVPLQLPYALSGGFVAIGLIGVGAAMLRVQSERSQDARERQAVQDMVGEAAALIPLLRARQGRGTTTSRVSE